MDDGYIHNEENVQMLRTIIKKMARPKHTVKEITEAIENGPMGWYHGEKKAENFYSGEVIKVISSNFKIPALEIAGNIIAGQFISNNKDYIAELEGGMEEVEAIAVKCIDGVVVISKTTRFFINGKRVEGYWYSESEPLYPMPKPNTLREEEAEEIFKLIKLKEEESQIHYSRGYSTSRIDQTILGSTEFEHEQWIWPEKYAEHYVLKYKVKPSEDFLNFIGWKRINKATSKKV